MFTFTNTYTRNNTLSFCVSISAVFFALLSIAIPAEAKTGDYFSDVVIDKSNFTASLVVTIELPASKVTSTCQPVTLGTINWSRDDTQVKVIGSSCMKGKQVVKLSRKLIQPSVAQTPGRIELQTTDKNGKSDFDVVAYDFTSSKNYSVTDIASIVINNQYIGSKNISHIVTLKNGREIGFLRGSTLNEKVTKDSGYTGLYADFEKLIANAEANYKIRQFSVQDISRSVLEYYQVTNKYYNLTINLKDGTYISIKLPGSLNSVTADQLKQMGFTGTIKMLSDVTKVVKVKIGEFGKTNPPTIPAPTQVQSTPIPVVPVASPVVPPVSVPNPTMPVFLPAVPASISGTGCTILKRSGSCVGRLTWKIDAKATEPRVENRSTGTFVSTGQLAQTGFWVALTPGSTMFAVRNGNTALGSVSIEGTCESGTVFDGNVCSVSKPVSSINTSSVKPLVLVLGASTNIYSEIAKTLQSISIFLNTKNN